jgi:hypothetical protein
MRWLILTIATVLLGTLSAHAQQSSQDPAGMTAAAASESREVATRALATFRKLVTEQNFRTFGFSSQDELRGVTLGDPVLSMYVRLDRLREYKENEDPNALFSGVGEKLVYPVLVSGDPRSTITLEKGAAGWKATVFGGPMFGKLFFSARGQRSSESEGVSFFAVTVPALSLYFLGAKKGTEVMLEPLIDDVAAELKAGIALPANRVFAKLVPVARAYNGLPR